MAKKKSIKNEIKKEFEKEFKKEFKKGGDHNMKMCSGKFPTFAVIVLVIGILWLLSEIINEIQRISWEGSHDILAVWYAGVSEEGLHSTITTPHGATLTGKIDRLNLAALRVTPVFDQDIFRTTTFIHAGID